MIRYEAGDAEQVRISNGRLLADLMRRDSPYPDLLLAEQLLRVLDFADLAAHQHPDLRAETGYAVLADALGMAALELSELHLS